MKKTASMITRQMSSSLCSTRASDACCGSVVRTGLGLQRLLLPERAPMTRPLFEKRTEWRAQYATVAVGDATRAMSGIFGGFVTSERGGRYRVGNQFKQQRRQIFIQTQTTPNPQSLMFLPGKEVYANGSMNFGNARESMRSPLAKKLFTIDGVQGVFFGADFLTVTKTDDYDWDVLKPEVFAAVMDFYASGEAILKEQDGENDDGSFDGNAILDTDSETVAMIKELLETRIKPAVAEDGGDIVFKKFDEENGFVYVELRGACDGCPSSTVTLKSGIENMLMHYVPEVKGVVPWEGDKEMDLLDMADMMRGRN